MSDDQAPRPVASPSCGTCGDHGIVPFVGAGNGDDHQPCPDCGPDAKAEREQQLYDSAAHWAARQLAATGVARVLFAPGDATQYPILIAAPGVTLSLGEGRERPGVDYWVALAAPFGAAYLWAGQGDVHHSYAAEKWTNRGTSTGVREHTGHVMARFLNALAAAIDALTAAIDATPPPPPADAWTVTLDQAIEQLMASWDLITDGPPTDEARTATEFTYRQALTALTNAGLVVALGSGDA